LRFKIFTGHHLESNDHQRIECNASSFEVLGAIGTLSFGKSFKCIHKSQLDSWRSSSGQSPIHEPTKRMDLDDVLPNNLSSKKTQVDLVDRDLKFDKTCSAFRMVACEHQCLNGNATPFE
jgi:hypothetical protein